MKKMIERFFGIVAIEKENERLYRENENLKGEVEYLKWTIAEMEAREDDIIEKCY